MTKSINEVLEQVQKQVAESVKECDERIASNDAIQGVHDNIFTDKTGERIPFYIDENSETLNPKWIDEAVDIAANLNLEGFDNAIYEDAFKNGMRHVLDMLEKEAL
jgi:hypothetical protein